MRLHYEVTFIKKSVLKKNDFKTFVQVYQNITY